MAARIYKPAKSATQSGMARTKQWLLAFEQDRSREIEPLMGWTSNGDTRQQLRLWFDTREEAEAYAQREGIAYRVEEPERSSAGRWPIRTISSSTGWSPGPTRISCLNLRTSVDSKPRRFFRFRSSSDGGRS